MISGVEFVFGEIPDLPVDVPSGVSEWYVMGGPGRFVQICMKKGGQWERWYCLQEQGRLKPGMKDEESKTDGGAL